MGKKLTAPGPTASIGDMEILVVEDEDSIADFLERGLEAEGYAVLTASDGVEGQRLALARSVDLVILDRMLPGRDGLEVLAAIRDAKPTLPVVVLSARGEVADRIEGLDRGATDYVAKPFSFEELAARVRAHLRQPDGEGTTTLEAGGIRLDLLARRVERDGLSARLPEREAELLAYLMRHAGQVCTHREILSTVWGYDHDPGTNVVQVYIGYLRKRLALPDSPAPIETVRSVGYRLAAEG
jgi:two-component system, OmpR family, response regulator